MDGSASGKGRRVPDPPGDAGDADVEAARGSAISDHGSHSSVELPVSVTGRLFRLAERLKNIQDLGARDYGLGFARGRVLWALQESGPVVMRALSEALAISPRTVTGLIDALEADGWVTRSPHPTDRRATVISLTPTADTALAQLNEQFHGLAHDLLGDVPPEDLALVRSVLTTFEDRLDEVVAERVKSTGPPAGLRP